LCLLAEGSLEVKLPTIWTDEKQRWEESEKRREEKVREGKGRGRGRGRGREEKKKKIKKEQVSEERSRCAKR
jgi:hypothetical protein